jgi:hypothetical protein
MSTPRIQPQHVVAERRHVGVPEAANVGAMRGSDGRRAVRHGSTFDFSAQAIHPGTHIVQRNMFRKPEGSRARQTRLRAGALELARG